MYWDYRSVGSTLAITELIGNGFVQHKPHLCPKQHGHVPHHPLPVSCLQQHQPPSQPTKGHHPASPLPVVLILRCTQSSPSRLRSSHCSWSHYWCLVLCHALLAYTHAQVLKWTSNVSRDMTRLNSFLDVSDDPTRTHPADPHTKTCTPHPINGSFIVLSHFHLRH
jgi:hypothetical protein